MRTAHRQQKIVNLKVNAALWAALKRHCQSERVQMREAIEYMIVRYIQEHESNVNHSST